MNEQMLQVLVQGGLASVSLVLIYVVYKMSTNHSHHIEESTKLFTAAMDRNTDAWTKNAETMGRLIEKLNR